jgi:hypothetical protein
MMGTGSSPDLVAVWEVHLPDGIHIVEFEHGTTTGKRILRKVALTSIVPNCNFGRSLTTS